MNAIYLLDLDLPSEMAVVQEFDTGRKAIIIEPGLEESYKIEDGVWCVITSPCVVTHAEQTDVWKEALITKEMRDKIYKEMGIHIE